MEKNGQWRRSDEPARSRADRRAAPRRPACSIPGLGAADIVAGPEVRLLNISRAGVLLESAGRLSTGAHICLRLQAADAVLLLKGRVLRSRTVTEGGRDLRYESAVAFDEDFVLLDQVLDEKAETAGRSPTHHHCPQVKQAAGPPDSPRLAGAGSMIFAKAFLAPRTGADLRRLLDLENA